MGSYKAGFTLLGIEDVPAEVQSALQGFSGSYFRLNGTVYWPVGRQVLCCADQEEALALLFAIQQHFAPEPSNDPLTAALQHLLLSLDENAAPEKILQNKMPDDHDRAVLLFQASGQETGSFDAAFRMMAPLETFDYPVPIRSGRMALIKNLDQQDEEDAIEYAAAVLDTMESEGISGITVGIGSSTNRLSGLKQSFQDAEAALNAGRKHHPDQRVFCFRNLALEIIVDQIPSRNKALILEKFNGAGSSFTLTDELKDTADRFLRNDLNLTATAKEMFIHRNTLTYRLDKIRKETGLNLQTFRDAAVFRILTEIAK